MAGLLSGSELNADQIAHGPGRPLILSHDQLEWTVMSVEGLAVHRIGGDDFSRMEAWIDLAQRYDASVAVRTRGDHVAGQRLSTKSISQWSAQLREQVGQADTGIVFIRIGVGIMEGHRDVGHSLQLGDAQVQRIMARCSEQEFAFFGHCGSGPLSDEIPCSQ